MPVDNRHPDYAKALPVWNLVENALSGEGAVKDAADIYLPRLSDQANMAYTAYKERAQFIEITQRTHEMLAGFMFRKDPQYVFDASLADFMDDATMSGLSFYDWLKDMARSVLGVGRRGTLIDWDEDEARPYLVPFRAQDIINWKTARILGHVVLSLLVLREMSSTHYGIGEAEGAPADEFEEKLYEQYRVYEILFDDEGRPFVRCRVWRKSLGSTAAPVEGQIPGTGPSGALASSGSGWVMVDESMPARGGVPLARIPFVFHGANNFLPAIDRVPMESVARINYSHYRTSADLENGLHFSGLPQLWAKGFGEDATKLPIGSSVAWVSDQQWAQCGYVQVVGGFEGLVGSMERKEKQMANLGARMLDPAQGRTPEAYDTVRIRQTGETVTLTNIAIALTQSSSKVLQWAQWWMTRTAQNPEDLADDAKVEMNTEFVENEIQPQQLQALVSAYLQKAISRKTLFFNLQRGDMYPPDTEYEAEVEEIANDPSPAGLPPVTGAAFGGGAPPREKPAPQAGA